MGKGRPKIQIDETAFENLCWLQCTLEEIAGFFKCSEDTVERWCVRQYGITFAEEYKKLSNGGKISLRRSQFRLAEKNAAMAIFLGKQYLGQRDNVNVALQRDMEDDPISKALKEETAHESVSEAEADP